jgi:hypothetical protein
MCSYVYVCDIARVQGDSANEYDAIISDFCNKTQRAREDLPQVR